MRFDILKCLGVAHEWQTGRRTAIQLSVNSLSARNCLLYSLPLFVRLWQTCRYCLPRRLDLLQTLAALVLAGAELASKATYVQSQTTVESFGKRRRRRRQPANIMRRSAADAREATEQFFFLAADVSSSRIYSRINSTRRGLSP